MLSNNAGKFLSADSEYSCADIVIFGVPFDGTTSFRPGTRFGPASIRSESFGLETYSPYLDKDLTDISVFDAGDIELPFGNTEKVLDMIEKTTSDFLSDNKIPVMLGGEHLITLGSARAVIKKYPDLHFIHFDAHTDLREEYLGETLSHATVIRRIWELTGDNKIYQFGIRSGEKHEFEFAEKHTVLRKYNLDGILKVAEQLKNKPVYVTIDLDVLDPSVFCGTGTPEPGGVSFNELMQAVHILKGLNIVAADINELSPVYDTSGRSTAVACKILRELLLCIDLKK